MLHHLTHLHLQLLKVLVEEAFSKLKVYLMRVGAHTHEALFEDIAKGARGWFTHCGYPTIINPSLQLDQKWRSL